MSSVVLCRTRAKGTTEESMAGLMFDGVKHRERSVAFVRIGEPKKKVSSTI